MVLLTTIEVDRDRDDRTVFEIDAEESELLVEIESEGECVCSELLLADDELIGGKASCELPVTLVSVDGNVAACDREMLGDEPVDDRAALETLAIGRFVVAPLEEA